MDFYAGKEIFREIFYFVGSRAISIVDVVIFSSHFYYFIYNVPLLSKTLKLCQRYILKLLLAIRFYNSLNIKQLVFTKNFITEI